MTHVCLHSQSIPNTSTVTGQFQFPNALPLFKNTTTLLQSKPQLIRVSFIFSCRFDIPPLTAQF